METARRGLASRPQSIDQAVAPLCYIFRNTASFPIAFPCALMDRYAMISRSKFREKLSAFVERQPNKAAAARNLGISRQDLYRYLNDITMPRPALKARLLRAMAPPRRSRRAAGDRDIVAIIGEENVTLVRQALLHLADALELDLRG